MKTERKSSILVTGATGFIGSHVVRQLLQKGEKAIASNVELDPPSTSAG